MHRVQAEAADAADLGSRSLDAPLLLLILQRPCANSKPVDVANLLLTSKSVRSAVLTSCKGLGPVEYTSAKTISDVQPFARWLAKYGETMSDFSFSTDLLNSFPVIYRADELERSAIEQSAATALQQAAHNSSTPTADATGNRLHLCSCTLHNAGPDIAAVLQQLPGSRLTQLDLGVYQPLTSAVRPSAYVDCFSNSLSHLTSLKNLKLTVASAVAPNLGLVPMLQQLSGLTNLTPLRLSVVTDNAALQWLPPSLKDLSFSWPHHALIRHLHLGHLTALTRLGPKPLELALDCILPASLVELHAEDLLNSACLMPLQNLQVLRLHQHHGEDANLWRLGALTALSHVKLYYNNVRNSEVTVCAWLALPLKHLNIFKSSRPFGWEADVVRRLGQLTQLTCLKLQHCHFKCTSATVAEALRSLVNIQCLFLGRDRRGSMFSEQEDAGDSSSGVHVLGALGSMRHLQELTVVGLPITYSAALKLAPIIAQQLTALTLEDCNLSNASLLFILQYCTQLRSLGISNNQDLDDLVLLIAATLSQLTEIFCSETGITKPDCLAYLPHAECYC